MLKKYLHNRGKLFVWLPIESCDIFFLMQLKNKYLVLEPLPNYYYCTDFLQTKFTTQTSRKRLLHHEYVCLIDSKVIAQQALY